MSIAFLESDALTKETSPVGHQAVSVGRLYPITPVQSHRYSRSSKIDLSHKTIQPGQFSCANEPEPSYLPQDWSHHVQPEGQAYFFNERSRVVTEANIYSSNRHSLIMTWIRAVEQAVRDQGLFLSDKVELFLQLDENDDDSCGYYFVDHASRTEFWLEPLSSENVDIPASASPAQLRWAFQEHYWMHVEYFPMHNGAMASNAIPELISILIHARGDHLTSSVGTFPYNATQCRDFISILQPAFQKTNHFDGYALCFAARIWTQVARHRFLNFYGETFARLSRDQHMIELPPAQCPLVLRPAVGLLFNLPRSYVSELEKLWVDNLVYADPYKQFMTNCLAEWKSSTKAAFLIFALHVLFVTQGFGSFDVGLSSIALSATAFIIGMILSHYHRMPLNFDTAEAADYLSQSNYGNGYGFHPLSIVYSLPKALLGWSTILVVVQAILAMYAAVSSSSDVYFQALIGALVFMAALIVVGVLGIMRRSFAAPFYQSGESAASRWINSVLEIFGFRARSSYTRKDEENDLLV